MGNLIKTRETSKRKYRFSSHSACLVSLQRRGMLTFNYMRENYTTATQPTPTRDFLLERCSVNQAGLLPRDGFNDSPDAGRRITAKLYVNMFC
jgi:hypothetical protein